MRKIMMMFLIFLILIPDHPTKADELKMDEMSYRKIIEKQTADLLRRSDFASLEETANEYRTGKSRTPSGIWKLTLFYDAISNMADAEEKNEDFWSSLKSKTEKWIRAYPKSPTPYIAHGIVLSQYAWKFRGIGYANTVSDDAWKPFRKHLDAAGEFLTKHKKIASADPEWYVVMANMEKARSVSKKEFEKLVNEGLSKEPLYFQLYFSAVDYFTPKWHGDGKIIEEFANAAVSRTKKQEGMGIYARIYWSAWASYYGKNLFTESDVVWDKMKQGIDDVIKKYPDTWNIYHFARFACLADDKEKTKELMAMLKLPVSPSDLAYHNCANWAYGCSDKK